jgi:hypothetical protein
MKITTTIFLFLLFTIIIGLPPAILQYTGNTTLLANGFWTLFCFMAGITFLITIGMLMAKNKNQEHFTPAFLGGTTVKILACLIFIFVFLHNKPADKHIFMADFGYIYLLNTAFEIYVLLRNLRHENLK